ncbi:hypothetical protein BH10ACT11_BH10ACT11_11500 [soil metagenome]
MRPQLFLLALAVSALLTGGCGEGGKAPTTPTGDALVHFKTGGGFAPRLREMVVEEDGSALLFGSDTESASFQLSDDELASLRETLDEHPPDEIDSNYSGGYCADCFTYSLEYAGGKITGDQDSLSAEAQDVISDISALADAHETEPPDPDARLVRYSSGSGLPGTFSTLTIANNGSARLRTFDATKDDPESLTEFVVPFDEMQAVRRTLALHPATDVLNRISPPAAGTDD